jgi:hypothetical protein
MAINKIDSNVTGLRYAEEDSLAVLPATPIWHFLEPNSYKDFGSDIKTVARSPINPTRQRKKGVVSDLDASGGFMQDLTQNNLTRLMQGFFFANIREKATTVPMNSTAVPITSVTASTKTYAAGSGLGVFAAGSLVLASGFSEAANNGLKTIASKTSTTVVVNETIADESSPATTAYLHTVGRQFASSDISFSLNSNYVRMASAAVDMTTLGLIVGEWVFVGGDSAVYTPALNSGFARISAITAAYIEFDKTSWEGAVDAATSKTVRVFFGSVIRNESDSSLIVRKSYNLERTLGSDANGVMSEYLVGAVANEMTINIAQADKVTMDMSFMATDNEQRSGATGVKSGTRPSLVSTDAFNTTSDFSRIKLASVSATDSSPVSLFAFATEVSLTLKNNISLDKAISVLGAFDITAGTFEIDGKITAYFADVAAVASVRNNSDITIDLVLVKNNAGILFDVPLLTLGDGRLTVEKDKPIMIPLNIMGAESVFGHTMLYQNFPYLPNLAQ